MAKKIPALPEPVKRESRNAFGIMWFASEKDAKQAERNVRARGLTYNGGWFHGKPCGRATEFDYTKDGQTFYAVTD